ncbi:MAG: radical SAM protein [Deltaproteobacteria bacterium]|nr:radical SAM protein [Deltaproteobacteria bacterium]
MKNAESQDHVLLIFPPVAKPSEPPGGIAVLSGALAAYNVEHTLLDANLEGMLDLLKKPFTPADTWTRRAYRNLSRNLSSLRSWQTYKNIDTYKRAVLDINRLLNIAGGDRVRISLADYSDARLSPVKSQDFLYAAQHPAENPFFEYFSDRLPAIIRRDKTTVAGFSLNYLSQALTTFAMIGFLKQGFPGITIVLGGSLVTSWLRGNQREGLFNGLIDHCVSGPGEYQLLALLQKNPSPKMHLTPCYDSLPISDYLAPGLILPFRSAIGCYWGKCSFCPEKAEGTSYEQIPPEKAAIDLRDLVARTKPALIHLVDNAISPALMQAICDKPPGAAWYGFARITEHLTDPGFCMALRQSGCVMLKLGLESGNQGVLDALHKGIDLKNASLALQNLKKAGIATYVYLLFGTPAETRIEAQHTLDFVAHHAVEIGFMNIAIFNLPLNSPEATGLETAGFYEGDLSLYTDFQHPHGWSRRSVREFLETEFRRHPTIRPILNNHPPFFTSNHAPFFAGIGQ